MHNQIKFQSHASTSITICNFRRHFSLLYFKNPTISTTFHFFIRFKQLWRVSVYYQTIPRLFRKAPIATSPQTDFRGFVFKLNRWHSFSWQPLLQMKCSKKSSWVQKTPWWFVWFQNTTFANGGSTKYIGTIKGRVFLHVGQESAAVHLLCLDLHNGHHPAMDIKIIVCL